MMTNFAQIQGCLRQPDVWRIVGFVSAVIGLQCYALSSSFDQLFGNWNLLKILLYSVISFVICLLILFAKVWQHSTGLRLQSLLTFGLLAITSFYSFYYDRGVKGKPDVYGLISSAAFAIMSLSLSRQTHCGFAVDLLYFFLGCLIVQLLKIKFSLALVGVGFSYFLIILRSCLDTPLDNDHNEYFDLQDQPHFVIPVDSEQPNTRNERAGMPEEGNTQDVEITPVNSHSQQAKALARDLHMPNLKACIEALQKENQNLIIMLGRHVREYLQSRVKVLAKDHNLVIDELPSEIINNLCQTVKLLVDAGLEEDCREVYTSCRREFLRKCLSSSQFLEFKDENEDILHWRWIWSKHSNLALRVLFPNERTLCNRIFSDFSSIADLSFREVCSELTKKLLSMANSGANGSPSPDLFRTIIRVLETLDDLIPEFESLFSGQHSVRLRDEAVRTRKSLGEATRVIFKELENHIRCDTDQAAVPQGWINPITSQVLEFLHDDCVLGARDTLAQVYQEQLMASDREGTSLFSVQIAHIMKLLEANMEAKSEKYSDRALGYIFMMNNLKCIEQRAIYFTQNHQAKVDENFEHYIRSWDEILEILKPDNRESMDPVFAENSMIKKLKLFNRRFEEKCSVQSKWFVSDQGLKGEIRKSLADILLPAYGRFLGMFLDVLGKRADQYIEYGILHIQEQLDRLFGVNLTENHVWSSPWSQSIDLAMKLGYR